MSILNIFCAGIAGDQTPSKEKNSIKQIAGRFFQGLNYANNNFFFRNISELKWKTCPNGKDCKNPHSVIELKVWALEIGFCLTRSELAKRFRNSLTKDRK